MLALLEGFKSSGRTPRVACIGEQDISHANKAYSNPGCKAQDLFPSTFIINMQGNEAMGSLSWVIYKPTLPKYITSWGQGKGLGGMCPS